MSAERGFAGGCLCGAVRYRVTGVPFETYHCHCGMCRRMQGAAFGTYSIWPTERFTLDRGADALDSHECSPGSKRHFCRTCGCNVLAWNDSDPGKVWVVTPTLDGGADPGGLDAAYHIFVGHKAAWYEIADELPQWYEWEETT
jgi:hypothetical protein